jgi:uncharacterized protein (TIGR03067 family)
MSEMILFTVLALGAPMSKETAPEAEKIVGDWEIESIAVRGETVKPVDKEAVFVIRFAADGKISWFDHKGRDCGAPNQSYALAKSSDHTHIDWKESPPDAPAKNAPGIVKIEGDQLTIAVAVSGADRPTSFDSSKLDSTTVFVLKRVQRKKN